MLLVFPHLWLQRQRRPLLWEGGCATQNLRVTERAPSSQRAGIIPASERLSSAKLGLCYILMRAEGVGCAIKRCLPLVCGGEKTTVGLFMQSGGIVFVIFPDYPLGYCLGFVVCVNT